MKKLLKIARLYHVEMARRQVYLMAALAGACMAVVPFAVTSFGMGAFERASRDVCLTLLGFLSVGLGIGLGCSALAPDLERRTLHPLLARPMPRSTYLWGRLLGVITLLGGVLLAVGAVMILACSIALRESELPLLLGVAACWLEGALLAAIAVLVGTRFGPVVSGVTATFAWLVGGLSAAYVDAFLSRSNQFAAGMVYALQLVIPHFQMFHVKNALVHRDPLSPAYVGAMFCYGLVWLVFVSYLADWSFSRRDL
ncbi:MAG: ABC transporter permease [Candidatus Xenobia bacterium]